MSTKKILFLCTGNYYRSRFAEELFNYRAALIGLPWRAQSRALAIERGGDNVGPISRFAIEALAALRIEPSRAARFPMACRADDLESADLIIALKEGEHRAILSERFPGWQSRVTYWHVHDIDVAEPVEALAMINRLVSKLIRNMETTA